MSIVKVIEIISESPDSFDDAVRQGIKRAARTVGNIKSAWVAEQKVIVDGSEVKEFRVTMRVSFVLDE